MKKIKLSLYFLLWSIGLVAQTSFPVQVTNQASAVPDAAYIGGSGNNAYSIQHITRTQILASPAAPGIGGNLFGLLGGYGPQPGKAAVISGFRISCNKPAEFYIRTGVATTPLTGNNIPEKNYGLIVDSGREATIYDPWVLRNGQSVIPYITKLLNPNDTAVDVTFAPFVYYITDDFNYNAKKTISWIGTSITNGTGPTATAYMYHTLFTSYLRSIGISVRNELNGISGGSTATYTSLFPKGVYDLTMLKKTPDVAILEIAVNDATVGVSVGTYVARMESYARRMLTNPDNAKLMVLVLSTTPLENNTANANAIAQNAATSAMVTSLQASFPNRVWFVDVSNGFDRLVTSNYASSDTPGQRIHPSDSGCQQIFTNSLAVWLSTTNGQTFIQRLRQ